MTSPTPAPAAPPADAPAAGPLPRRRTRPLTCLADAREFDLAGTSRFSRIFPQDPPDVLPIRKRWEWDYIAECVETLGLLGPGRRAVGMGVGNEPLIFYFAQAGCSVLATDLYAGDTSWSEARFANTEAVHAAATIAYPRENVEIANADMRHLPCEDASADFVWSCSSIEHIPNLRDLFAVLQEAWRVLKPGGHAVLTTEYVLGEEPYLLPGVNAWNRDILQLIRDAFPGFAWVGETDLSHDATHPANSASIRRHLPPYSSQRHATELNPAFRGGNVAALLGVSACVPIAFTLRKQDGANLSWEDAPVPDELRRYTQGLIHFDEDRPEQAVETLGPLLAELRQRPDRRQLALHTGRFLIDAHVRGGLQEKPDELRSLINDYLTLCPPGELQDGDCLDLCGYLLGEIGDHDDAARVLRLAVRSPSTNTDHFFALAGRLLNVEQRAGRLPAAVDEVAVYLADLAWCGVSRSTLDRGIEREFSTLDPRDLKRLRRATASRIDELAQDLKNRFNA